MDAERLVTDYITAYQTTREVSGDDPRFQAIMELDRLAHDDPEAAWPLIQEIIRRDQSEHVMEMLSAGPLEDLIRYHGPIFIDRIEAKAQGDPHFRNLLGGVWQGSTPDVWARVEKVRGDAW
jgi:hypothetical protein